MIRILNSFCFLCFFAAFIQCSKPKEYSPDYHEVEIDSIGIGIDKVDSVLLYSNEELITFLDTLSINKMNTLNKFSDSIFNRPESVSGILETRVFNELKRGCNRGRVTRKLANRIFTMTDFSDETFFPPKRSMIQINCWKLDDGKNKDRYIIAPGIIDGSWEVDLYFFQGKDLVAYHRNYHRSGVDLGYFIDQKGETVVHYQENFSIGTGRVQSGIFFYRFHKKNLIPVLNVMNKNVLFDDTQPFNFIYEAEIVKARPLTLEINYKVYCNDSSKNQLEILSHKAKLRYFSTRKKFKLVNIGSIPNSVMNLFSSNTNMRVVYAFKDEFILILNGKDNKKKKALSYSINELINNLNLDD